MNDDEMNKKMEFIVEQQAKFATDIEIMREVQAADAQLLKDGLIGLVDIVGSLTRAQIGADGRIDSLAEAQKRTDESLKRLSEAQAQTEASLKILISVVERHISGNGGAENRA
jgi:allophanate hydrolase subunit 1